MKNPFKKTAGIYKGLEPITPYQRAQQEWDDRIGAARVQTRNWRLVALLSLFMTVVSITLAFTILITRRDKVFIAEVTSSGQVVNVAPLLVKYQPTIAQKQYFINQFIELIRTLPLDPVVAKHNWLKAYSFLVPRSAALLNEYFRKNNPITLLGKSTITPKIISIHPVSEKTFQVDWTENTVNANGQDEGQKHYNGIFTVYTKQPISEQEILQNPLGIYLVDFHISLRED